MNEPFASLPDEVRDRLQRKGMPDWTAPMLATLTDERFSSADWVYERKLDGERCLVFRDGRGVRILSRNRKKLNDTYPELVKALEDAGSDRFIADGEIVAFDDGIRENGAHWLKPELVGEFGFTEWTGDGKLRHPRYIGLREDKPANKVRRERPKHA